MKRFFFIVLLLIAAVKTWAQYDASFAHYWAMEPSFNPATVGKEAKLNIAGAYAIQLAGFEHNPNTMYAASDMPFYAMGLMLGLCLLHTFVVEDEKEERRKQLEALIKMQQIHEQELGAARYMAYTDPLTGVKNKAAYIEEVGNIEKSIAEETITELGIVFFDLNGLK